MADPISLNENLPWPYKKSLIFYLGNMAIMIIVVILNVRFFKTNVLKRIDNKLSPYVYQGSTVTVQVHFHLTAKVL